MNPDETVLTDEMWERIEQLMPGKATDPGSTAADNRLFLEAVLWRARTGSTWRTLPERFGNWNSVFQRFRRWGRSGVCERVFNALSEDFDFGYMYIDGNVVLVSREVTGAEGEPSAREPVAPGAD